MPRLATLCILRCLALLILVLPLSLTAGGPALSKYPLRIHVLASDTTYKIQRMRPEQSVVCDAIDDMVSSISPSPTGPITLSGVSGDPCSLHASTIAGRLLDIQNNDYAFSGTGRADLVSPPSSTQAFTFHYSDCMRMRVRPGFQSLPARWKKSVATLEVLLPSDDIPVDGRPLPPARCRLTVTMHDFVYLLLRDGTLIGIPQEEYWKRPALRVFLSGIPESVQQRARAFTVSAHPTN